MGRPRRGQATSHLVLESGGGDGWVPGIVAGGRDVSNDARLGGNATAGGHADVVLDRSPMAQHNAVTQGTGCAHTCPTAHDAAAADRRVMACTCTGHHNVEDSNVGHGGGVCRVWAGGVPMWTRLSILAPLSITVSRQLPRSMTVLVPMSTLSLTSAWNTCASDDDKSRSSLLDPSKCSNLLL